MKKTFKLSHPKTNVDRVVDAVKHDIKKYLARERRKKLPEGVDYWDFDCKVGSCSVDAEEVPIVDINKFIDVIKEREFQEVYVEILAKAGRRTKKPDSTKKKSG